jgi:hypothetical protein
VCAAAGKARAKNDVSLAIDDGLDEPRVFLRIVFEIGILHEDDGAGRVAAAKPGRSAAPA